MIDKLQKYQINQDQIVWFDAEAFEEVEAYQEIFIDLIKISKLEFSNVAWRSGYSTINDSYMNKSHYLATATFMYQNTNYCIKISCEEWFDEHLIQELNHIIQPYTNSQFVILKTGDQSLAIVFASPMQYQQLAKDQMIEDEYETIYPDNWNELMF